VLLAGLVAWSAAGALAIHPDYLAYFNPIAGGPDGGPRYLLDSNIDWGQDLPGLADYLRKQGHAGPVYFGYFGEDAPERWGLEPRQVFRGARGVVAVSVNYLYGMPYRTYSFTDWAVYRYPPNYFGWLRREKPVAVIGHTIYVYRTDRE
jgi:hypothetical protein